MPDWALPELRCEGEVPSLSMGLRHKVGTRCQVLDSFVHAIRGLYQCRLTCLGNLDVYRVRQQLSGGFEDQNFLIRHLNHSGSNS